MSPNHTVWIHAAAAFFSLAALCLTGCGPGTSTPVESPELAGLRKENEEVQRLQRDNADLPRLRKQNQEMQLLRDLPKQLAQLRDENQQLRSQLAALPEGSIPTPAATGSADTEPAPIQPIANLAQAFDEAAAALPEAVEEKDKPMEGDLIQVDQSVIGLLIPEFATNQSTTKYEMSGWLKGKGVNIRNYQQLNLLGITNYQIVRTKPQP